jgi:hypothetical protein
MPSTFLKTHTYLDTEISAQHTVNSYIVRCAETIAVNATCL